MNEMRIRPSRAAYLLPALILVGGAYGFAHVLWTDLGNLGERLPQMTVPGEKVFDLKEAGTYTIFHEHESVMDNRVFSSLGVALNVKCKVTAEATGQEIPLTRPGINSTYVFGGRAGTSVLDFKVLQPGNYRIACKGSDETEDALAVFAIGHNFGDSLFNTVGLSLFLLFASLAVAGGGFCGIWWMREKSKARVTGHTPGAPPVNLPLG